MHLSSVYVLFLSCILLLSPLSASSLLPIHDSQSNPDDSGLLTPPDGLQPPISSDIGENFAEPPPPPSYQDDILGSPPIGTPNNGNADLLPSVPPPSAPADDVTPSIVPPAASDNPPPTPQLPVILTPPPNDLLPLSPQLPVILTPPPDNSLPLSPQLPSASPPPDSSMPESPQLPLAPPPPLYNTLPGSPHSPLPYQHPADTQPGTSTAPAPFGVYPSGENQGQQFGQANNGLFAQQQSSNDLPFGGPIGGCSSTMADFVEITMTFIGVLLIYWV